MYAMAGGMKKLQGVREGSCQGQCQKDERELDMQTSVAGALGREAAELRPEVDSVCSRLGVWRILGAQLS